MSKLKYSRAQGYGLLTLIVKFWGARKYFPYQMRLRDTDFG